MVEVRKIAMQQVAEWCEDGTTVGELLEDSEQVYQWLVYGTVPKTPEGLLS